MGIVRGLLNQLDRGALARLQRLRGLHGGGSNGERRASLARSYRGGVDELIQQMEHGDLVSIFNKRWFEIGGERMHLPDAESYDVDDLRRFARKAFAGGRLRGPSPFQPFNNEDDEDSEDEEDEDSEDEEDEEDEDDDEDEEDDDEDEEDEEDEDEEDDEDDSDDGDDGDDDENDDDENVLPFALRGVGPDWSRPRSIPRLLRAFGGAAPSRLRTVRFQGLVASLRVLGIDACLAGDKARTPLEEDAESPGMKAKLLLRLRHPSVQAQESRNSPVAALAEPGPTKVIVVSEQPVIQRVPRPSDYQLAVLRLQFLTAVPSVERRSMPAWPKGYLDAATRGLSLRPQELTFLAALATGLCIGNHSPIDAISQLELGLTRDEWDTLIADFQALNPFQPELVGAITEQVSPFGSWPSGGAWQSSSRPSVHGSMPAPAERPSPAHPGGSLGAVPPRKVAIERDGAGDTKNVRSLGALGAMFDEE